MVNAQSQGVQDSGEGCMPFIFCQRLHYDGNTAVHASRPSAFTMMATTPSMLVGRAQS